MLRGGSDARDGFKGNSDALAESGGVGRRPAGRRRPAVTAKRESSGAAARAAAQVLLLVGDDFRTTAAARAWVDGQVPPADQALGLEIVDGRVELVADALLSVRRCLEAVRTVGFLGGRKVVWWRDVSFLTATIAGRNQEVLEAVRTLAASIDGGLPPGHHLLITAPGVDQRTVFFKACQRHGELREFALAEKPWNRMRDAQGEAAQAFRKAGLAIAGDALQSFVERVGTDPRQLHQEIAKLATYLGDRTTVTPADIAAITSASREVFWFEFEDAVAERNLATALTRLRRLLFQREHPIRLITGLETRFRYLLLFREALDQGWIRVAPGSRGPVLVETGERDPESDAYRQALAGDKGASLHPFQKARLAAQAVPYTLSEIVERRAWILETRRRMVSATLHETLALEYLVIRMCRSP